MRTAIVLAGGRSARFGADKLTAQLEGLSLVSATISRFVGIVDGLIVAGSEPSDWRRVWDDSVPLAIIPDADPFGGPLAALANVLRPASPDQEDLAIVVGGDMPALVPDVLRAMFDRLERGPSVDALVLGAAEPLSEPVAPLQVLPLALRVASARTVVLDALGAGRHSLRSLLDDLAWAAIPGAEWLPLDPSASTLLDVDTPEDLDRLRAGKGR